MVTTRDDIRDAIRRDRQVIETFQAFINDNFQDAETEVVRVPGGWAVNYSWNGGRFIWASTRPSRGRLVGNTVRVEWGVEVDDSRHVGEFIVTPAPALVDDARRRILRHVLEAQEDLFETLPEPARTNAERSGLSQEEIIEALIESEFGERFERGAGEEFR